jgi:hypothetical protein
VEKRYVVPPEEADHIGGRVDEVKGRALVGVGVVVASLAVSVEGIEGGSRVKYRGANLCDGGFAVEDYRTGDLCRFVHPAV